MNDLIREFPEESRPYEKAFRHGVETLDDAELLAVILRTGTGSTSSVTLARKVLQRAGGSLSGLYALTAQDLMKIPGIGRVKALELECVRTLAGRFGKSRQTERPVFNTPAGVVSYYGEEMRSLRQETVKLLLLNTKCALIYETMVSKGSVNASLVPVREILAEALRRDAVSMILVHNHPSGDPTPSREDIEVTEKLREAGKLVGIGLLDHIVIGDGRYISLNGTGNGAGADCHF